MNKLTIEEIVKASGGILLSGRNEDTVSGVSTDSRTVSEYDLFVPVVGEIHDAHKFIPQVVERGCRTLFISNKDAEFDCKDCNVILTDDTTTAMQRLASYYLKKLNLKTVAVTGSVGKTSTRDMVHAILSEKYVTGKTLKNFNSEVGVPLTIFSFDDTMEAAVLEVGMDKSGEIHRLVDIIRPDIGIITNIGISHIENLGSRQGIFNAKMEITDFFDTDNILIVNRDNDILGAAEFPPDYKVVGVGSGENCEYRVGDVCDYGEDGITYRMTHGGREYDVKLSVPGAHNAMNSALAMAACEPLGVSAEQAISGLVKTEFTANRLNVKDKGGIKVIDDTYNAAPDSMKSLLNTLVNTRGIRKIAILGDMNELGKDSEKYHREVGAYAVRSGVDILITVGEKAKAIAAGAEDESETTEILSFAEKDGIYPMIKEMFRQGDVIAVKGSRTMELEKVAEKIIEVQE